jgi:hypothetical protein
MRRCAPTRERASSVDVIASRNGFWNHESDYFESAVSVGILEMNAVLAVIVSVRWTEAAQVPNFACAGRTGESPRPP